MEEEKAMGDCAHRRKRTLFVLDSNGESSHKTTTLAIRKAGGVLEVNSLEHACVPRLLESGRDTLIDRA